MKKTYTMDMTEGPILKKMLIFSLPLMLSSILQLMFNAADIMVVGKFAGDASLAGVGACGSLINLITNLFIGLSVGTNVIIARYYGAGEQEECSKSVHTAMLISLIGGLVLTVIGFVGAETFLTWMKTPENVLPLSALYMRIYFLGMPIVMVYNFGSAILRAVGDTKRPLYFLFAAGIVNVVLNLVFVIAFRMDVAGVALATILSQALSAFLVVFSLFKEEDAIRLSFGKLRVHRRHFLEMLRIGIPAGLQGTLFSLSNVVIQSGINHFGDVMVSASAAAANIEGFIYTGMNAFYQSTVSFCSQNIGGKKYDRIIPIVKRGMVCAIVTGIVLSSLVLIFSQQFLGLYSSTQEVIDAGKIRLLIICIPYFLLGMMDIMVGALRGIGYSVAPMIISLCGVCGLRLLWTRIVFLVPALTKIEMIFYSYPASWVITFVMQFSCFLILWKRKRRQLEYDPTESKIPAKA